MVTVREPSGFITLGLAVSEKQIPQVGEDSGSLQAGVTRSIRSRPLYLFF